MPGNNKIVLTSCFFDAPSARIFHDKYTDRGRIKETAGQHDPVISRHCALELDGRETCRRERLSCCFLKTLLNHNINIALCAWPRLSENITES